MASLLEAGTPFWLKPQTTSTWHNLWQKRTNFNSTVVHLAWPTLVSFKLQNYQRNARNFASWVFPPSNPELKTVRKWFSSLSLHWPQNPSLKILIILTLPSFFCLGATRWSLGFNLPLCKSIQRGKVYKSRATFSGGTRFWLPHQHWSMVRHHKCELIKVFHMNTKWREKYFSATGTSGLIRQSNTKYFGQKSNTK